MVQEQDALIKAPQEIVALTTSGPATYQKDAQGNIWGVDAELLKLLGARYGIKIKFKVYRSQEEVIAAFRRGEGTIAAARLPALPFGFRALSGPAMDESNLSLFCLNKLNIESANDLQERIIVGSLLNSNMEVQNLFRSLPQPPILQSIAGASSRELLHRVLNKKADCAILDTREGHALTQTFLMVTQAFSLTEPQPIRWWIQEGHTELAALLKIWFQRASRDEEIMQVMDRYQPKEPALSANDIRSFYRNVRTTLPQLQRIFKKAAEQYDVPWEMIAAVAYQESHWDSEATSYTGVKGLMQITQDTADHLGVQNREDPAESIAGGTRYLRYLFALTPPGLERKERWAITLAAYNIGYAHLRDAQKLAAKRGFNPYAWRDLKNILPLLAEATIYEDLEFGYARGFETVQYVDRTIAFYRLLALRN